MLDLQRASAGSGKTYTLAKKYIWYLITLRPEGSRACRLRTPAELADSASHILAITFTNKATNEMQMRIVDKLYALGNAKLDEKLPDYLEEFAITLSGGTRKPDGTLRPEEMAAAESIRDVSRKAISILLENYSDFNVSTIDSFFQNVLRTFAYESEINDTYQVEIDSNFLSQMGIDATLEEIDRNDAGDETPFWIKALMQREERNWNIFQRKESTLTSTPYSEFIKSIGRLENEDYKEVRVEVERYLSKRPDLITPYLELIAHYEIPAKKAYTKMMDSVSRLYGLLPDDLRNQSRGKLSIFRKICQMTCKIKESNKRPPKWNTLPADDSKLATLTEEMLAEPAVEALKNTEPKGKEIIEMATNALRARDKWMEIVCNPEFRTWLLYAANLPYMALFDVVNRKRREYLSENNLVELGETAMLLQGVIGDSDAPFIYERLGTYLNHFLIDEFQDTSRLQWKNLSPLLKESMSRNNDNLIIGDAKQSIYRFRNAEPRLITEIVPNEFAGRVNHIGHNPDDNKNYRSTRNVVRFNNSLFDYITRRLDAYTQGKGEGRRSFSDLYSNVVQLPNKREDEGYVEARIFDSVANINSYILENLPAMIQEMRRRGYRERDIAVLVNTNNSQGNSVIEILRNYNNNRPEDEPEIHYVSEQSLKVASSRAVGIVTGVLENAAKGNSTKLRPEEERNKYGAGNWRDLSTNFKFFSMQRSADEPMAQRIDAFINGDIDFDPIGTMLREMPATALPSLVEAAIATFVDEKLRRQDALYLAAFQDIVSEYCESHPTDLASFLNWWERKKRSASVASPEDTDAVQVLTIHKSKGLEYECVIVPFANWDFSDAPPSDTKKEWRWVQPRLSGVVDMQFPPYMPVNVGAGMKKTYHSDLLEEFFDQAKMDALNSAYVGFTRACRELYILATRNKKPQKPTPGKDYEMEMGNYIMNMFNTLPNPPADCVSLLTPRMLAGNLEEMVFTVGEKPLKAPTPKDKDKNILPIEDYATTAHPKSLKFKLDKIGEKNNEEDEDAEPNNDAEDLDIREEGTLKHAVLETVKTRRDLTRSVRRLVLSGEMSAERGAEIEKSLSESLANPMVERWFDGRAKVVTERAILQKGNKKTRRPDRILIFEDGHAEVVDYKFGKIDKTGEHHRQVARYVRLLRESGRFRHVTGYLWYVNANHIELV